MTGKGEYGRIEDPEARMEGLLKVVEQEGEFPSSYTVRKAKQDDPEVPNTVALREMCRGCGGRTGWPAVRHAFEYWLKNDELPEKVRMRVGDDAVDWSELNRQLRESAD